MTKADTLELLAWFHAKQNPHYPPSHREHFGYVAALFIGYGGYDLIEDIETPAFKQRVCELTPAWMLKETT